MKTGLFVLLFLGLGLTSAEGPLKVTVSVNDVKPEGIDVTVTCDFLPAIASSSDSLVSLTLSQRGVDRNFTDIATVNALNPGEQTTAQDFEGTVSGMAHASGNASYLKVGHSYFSLSDVREFQCESTSINRFGHCVKFTQKANISLDGNERLKPSAIRKLLELQKDLEHAKSQLDQCGTDVKRLHGKLSAVLQKQEGSDLIWVSDIFNSSTFYIPHKSAQACSRLNGYLAEINTEEEFLFIQDMLIVRGLPSGLEYLRTGASYSSLTAPFKFSTHPEDPVYTGHWGTNEPHRDDMKYNWILIKYRNGTVTMVDGIERADDVVPLCEIQF